MAGLPEKIHAVADAPRAVITAQPVVLWQELARKFDAMQEDAATDARFEKRQPFAQRLSGINPALIERIAGLFKMTVLTRSDNTKRTIQTRVKNQAIQFFSSLDQTDRPHTAKVIVPSRVDESPIEIQFRGETVVVLGKESVSFVQQSHPEVNPGDYLAITLISTGFQATRGNEDKLLENPEKKS